MISYLGGTYVQVSRRGHAAPPATAELDHSANWHIYRLGNADLLLVTPGDSFKYRLEQNC